MVEIGYEFGPTYGGNETGFNDAATTMFNTDIPSAIARESIQNIIDASINTSGTSKAIAKINLIKTSATLLPKANELINIIKACREYESHVTEAVKFFDKALSLLNGTEEINILEISDYNTVGLSGDDEDRKGNYYNFLKSVGSSSKQGNEGGSFGLGKGSLFAASAFRTIFVSSIYNTNKHVFQGKLMLVSHLMSGKKKQGNGSFGVKPEQRPIRSAELIPEIFRRTEQGTSIFIIGFQDATNWKEHIIKSVLSNFWLAILKERLEVTVGEEKITATTLNGYMESCYPNIDENEKDCPLPYYKAYTDKDRQIATIKTLDTLGEVKLYLITGEKLPKRVSYFRKTGMLIKPARHNSIQSYAGVFICDNEKGNEILRRMEPPAHDDWTKDSPNAKRDGRPIPEAIDAERELKSFIRDNLKKLISDETSTSLTIEGLSKYLYLPGDETDEAAEVGTIPNPPEISSRETPTETILDNQVITPGVTRRNRDQSMLTRTTGGGEDGQALTGGEDQNGQGQGEGTGQADLQGRSGNADTETGEELVKIIRNIKYRTYALRQKDGSFEHVMIIRGEPNKKCDLNILAGTDDSFDALTIEQIKDSNGKSYIINGKLIKGVELDSAGEVKLKAIFDSKERYSLKVQAYEAR